MPPLLRRTGHWGTVSKRTANKKLEQTVLTITKSLTKVDLVTTMMRGDYLITSATIKKIVTD